MRYRTGFELVWTVREVDPNVVAPAFHVDRRVADLRPDFERQKATMIVCYWQSQLYVQYLSESEGIYNALYAAWIE